MKALFFLLFLQSSMLWSQPTEVVKTYYGVVNKNASVSATFSVEKTLRNDSIVWSYVFLHDNDSTIYDLKYSINGGLLKVHYNGDEYSLSDSVACNNESIYVFDFNFPNNDVVEGFFCVSSTFGLVSVGDFYRADYLKFEDHPPFDSCIDRYRIERSAHQ